MAAAVLLYCPGMLAVCAAVGVACGGAGAAAMAVVGSDTACGCCLSCSRIWVGTPCPLPTSRHLLRLTRATSVLLLSTAPCCLSHASSEGVALLYWLLVVLLVLPDRATLMVDSLYLLFFTNNCTAWGRTTHCCCVLVLLSEPLIIHCAKPATVTTGR